MTNNNSLVVIIGRTNVGKSTLFNRLVEKNQAIISKIEHTTRDSNLNLVSWDNFEFNLVDTAGVININAITNPKAFKEELKKNSITAKAQKQVGDFFKKADLVLFLVDGQAGLLAFDKEVAAFLKKDASYRKKTLLVVNKLDNFKSRSEAAEFNKLGLGEPIPISAITGSGTGDLLDEVIKKLKAETKQNKTSESAVDLNRVNVCIIGKPNVGKSSLLNSILGYERVIVSEIPHTTREPQNTEIIYENNLINLIDTAGISKQGHKSKDLEKYGILRSHQALRKADIILLVLDISDEITHQDARIIEKITDEGKSFIILANKWDLVQEKDTKKFTNQIYGKLPFVTWAPVEFISALTGSKVKKILALILKIAEARKISLSDSQLSKFLGRIVKIHKPAKGKGVRHPRIYELSQTKVDPPRFEMRIGHKDDLHFSYVRFVENRLREQYNFIGTPLRIRIVKTYKVHGQAEK